MKKDTSRIPFNKPHLTKKELKYIKHAHSMGHLAGDGFYTKKCNEWIEHNIGVSKALLTHSCTAALEMMAILSGVQPGDEVIMPSFTFVSTANAFVLRGATPVFVDIRPDTLNIDETLIEKAITSRTKAIVPVHYAGVSCEMDTITEIAASYKLPVLVDAAQAFTSTYKGKDVGTLGDMNAYSFHETKNVISGEGGALVINNDKYVERAEIIREKGTNRSKFFRGLVDKYTWVDIGSSYLPSEIVASFLYAQLENVSSINTKRIRIWNTYHKLLHDLEKRELIRRPIIPDYVKHNGHLYYILLNDMETRTKLIEYLRDKGILSVFHYVPLHSSPAGKKYSRSSGQLRVTNSVSDRLLRLPLYYDMKKEDINEVVELIHDFFTK